MSRPRRRPPEDPLTARIRALRGDDDTEERDATVAMIVVRALERAKDLAKVEGSGLALRRTLSAAEKPLAAYLERHLAQKQTARRKKA